MNTRLFVLFLAGALFGIGLALSGMTDPARVIAFLDVAGGSWDPALLFVMGGALGTYAILMAVMRRFRGGRGWFGTSLPKGESDPLSRRLVVGAVLFGVGWGLAGYCPGPALANLGAMRPEAMLFVFQMTLGMLIAQRGMGADA